MDNIDYYMELKHGETPPNSAVRIRRSLRRLAKTIGAVPTDNRQKKPAPKPDPYTKAGIELMDRWVDSGRTRARSLYLALGLGAGLRLGEMNDLRWSQVTGDRDTGLVLTGVAGRDVPVIDYFADALFRYREDSDTFIFTTRGKRKDIARKAIAPARYKDLRTTTTRMRDTWAEMLLNAGVAVAAIRQGLGASGKASRRFADLDENVSREAFRFQLHGSKPLKKPRLRSV